MNLIEFVVHHDIDASMNHNPDIHVVPCNQEGVKVYHMSTGELRASLYSQYLFYKVDIYKLFALVLFDDIIFKQLRGKRNG
jgi:hypothetical protein